MKRFAVVLVVLLLFVSFTADLKAERPFDIYFNATFATDDSFDFNWWYWGLGANADFHITDLIMISPEANVWTAEFDFDAFVLDTAVMLNFKLSNFFLGAGFDKAFNLSNWVTTDIGLRLNAGIVGNNLRFVVFLITYFDSLFSYNEIGLQAGFGF